MSEEPIDRILSREEEIFPSVGFTASVMEAVRREASVPAPIPFPWKRAWPMLALAVAGVVVALVATAMLAVRLATAPALAATDWTTIWKQIPEWMKNPAAAWTAGSLLLAFVSVKFSARLASR